MRPLWIALLAAAATLAPAAAQPRGGRCCGGAAPVASNPVVEIKGEIKQVHISRGQGMPYLEVQQGAETHKVYLGSMRYLIAEDFNPKAGEQVTLKGYKSADAVMAIEVSLPASKKTLKLRDENGWPLWRGGPMRRGPAR